MYVGASRLSDPVAAFTDGVDNWRVAELGPQPPYRGLDRGGEGVGRFVPDPFEQLLSGDQSAGGGEQALQDGELLRAEVKAPAGTQGDPVVGVEGDVTAFQCRGQRRGGAPSESADAGHELGEVEGFGQVVVGAQAEAVDALPDGAGRGQHQHPALRVLGHDLSADLVAVGSGQVPVQHHDVVAGDGQIVEGVVAVEDHVDGHALAAQSGPDGAGQDLEVFNDQHSHDLLVTLLDGPGPCPAGAGCYRSNDARPRVAARCQHGVR